MAAFDYTSGGFPASPAADDTLAMKGTTYKYNGSAWEVQTGGTTSYVYTATSGQTAFTGADSNSKTLAYSAGNTHVFLNGVLLDAADYTATDGTTVTLGTGASTGDTLQVVAYGVLVSSGGGGGGAWEVISSTTVTSAVSSVDFESFGTHTKLALMYEGAYGSSGDDWLFQLKINGSYKTSGYVTRIQTHNTSSTTTAGNSAITKGLRLGYLMNSKTYSSSGLIDIPHVEADITKTVRGQGVGFGYNYQCQFWTSGCYSGDGTALDQQGVLQGIRIKPEVVNISGGTFTLYGIKTS